MAGGEGRAAFQAALTSAGWVRRRIPGDRMTRRESVGSVPGFSAQACPRASVGPFGAGLMVWALLGLAFVSGTFHCPGQNRSDGSTRMRTAPGSLRAERDAVTARSAAHSALRRANGARTSARSRGSRSAAAAEYSGCPSC